MFNNNNKILSSPENIFKNEINRETYSSSGDKKIFIKNFYLNGDDNKMLIEIIYSNNDNERVFIKKNTRAIITKIYLLKKFI